MDVEKYVQVTQTGKGVYLNLEHAEAVANLPDFPGELIRHLLMVPIENLNQEKVRQAVSSLGKEVLVAPPQQERKHGRFNLLLSPDGSELQMSIIPPQDGGSVPQLHDVMREIKEVGAAEFKLDEELIQKLLRSREKTGFTVIGKCLDMEARLDINTDWTECSLTLTPPYGGKTLTADEVLASIEAKGIVNGLNKELVKELVNGRRFNEAVVVARGKVPVEGEDAFVDYTFDVHQRRARPTVNEDGSVNMKELNLIDSVGIGTVLARKTPPTEGVCGVDIRGKDMVVRNGKDCTFMPGRGADFNPQNPLEIVAVEAGQPKLAAGRVTVVPLLEIRSDVDFGTGNVTFMGDVRISGNVLAGFTVKASGDVEVQGVVEAACIEAGGNIMIKAGVVGQGQAVVSAKRNIVSRYLDSGKIFADGDITVEESVLNCEVSALGPVKVLGKKGAIIGGFVRSSRLVQVRQMGGPVGTPTKVEVGGSPKIFQELAEMDRLTAEIRRRHEEIEKTVNLLKKEKERDGDLSHDRHQKFIMATRSQFVLLSKLKSYKYQRDALREQMEARPGERTAVEVYGTCYPNVSITIRNATTKVVTEVSQVRFTEHDDLVESNFLSAKG